MGKRKIIVIKKVKSWYQSTKIGIIVYQIWSNKKVSWTKFFKNSRFQGKQNSLTVKRQSLQVVILSTNHRGMVSLSCMTTSKIFFVLDLIGRLQSMSYRGGGRTSFFETQNRSKYSRQRLGSLPASVISVASLIQSYTGFRNMIGGIVLLKVIWVTI